MYMYFSPFNINFDEANQTHLGTVGVLVSLIIGLGDIMIL